MKIINLRASQQAQSNLKAFFDLELDNGMILKGFKVVQGPTGLFVGVPSEKDANGKWWDRVIVPRELKDELNQLGIDAFRKMGDGAPAAGVAPPRAEDKDLPF